jgi:hypothetical protein
VDKRFSGNKKRGETPLFPAVCQAEVHILQLIFLVNLTARAQAAFFCINAAAFAKGAEHGFCMDLVLHIADQQDNVARYGFHLAGEFVVRTYFALAFEKIFLRFFNFCH